MSFLRTTTEKDLRRLARDPAAVAISIAIPLALAVLLRLMSGGGDGGTTPTAKLLVADNDGTFITDFLSGTMNQNAEAEFIEAQAVTEEEGRALMDEGKASGLLIIPEGFGENLLQRKPVTLSLITNPSQNILPKILEETLFIVVDFLNGLQNILDYSAGPLLDRLAALDGTPDNQLVADISVAVNQLMTTADPYLFPPVIEVKTEVIEQTKNKVTLGSVFFPSMCFLAVIFVAQNLSDDLWKEKMAGTLRRTFTSPQHLSQVLLGKALVASALFFVVALVAFGTGRWLLGIEFTNIVTASLWTTFGGLGMFAFFSFLQIVASSQRAASLLATAFLFPLVMIGGAFFPFEVMPDWMARIGRVTPNGMALESLKSILGGTPEPAQLALATGVLLVFTTFFSGLVLVRLRRFAVS